MGRDYKDEKVPGLDTDENYFNMYKFIIAEQCSCLYSQTELKLNVDWKSGLDCVASGSKRCALR